ncbi:MAG: hypothetical protein HND52_04315 [Ignavibacteriae bacterium]|nr:hypothetical protein [Ignavibacteriota bacterium]NOG97182.1 hypothetical protein [Ignavibacteriota bacterium]
MNIKKNYLTKLAAITLLLLLSISACKSDEENPIEPITVGAIQGQVTSAVNGLSITKANIFTVPPTSRVTTDADGNYLISNVEPGEYTITASKEGMDTLNAEVTVAAGAETKADFILNQYDSLNSAFYGIITGTVKNAIDELALSNVSIRTIPPTSSVSTNSAGYFLIPNVEPGEYLVDAKKIGYDSTQITVTVFKGKTVFADLIIVPADTSALPTTAKISGYAVDASTGNKLSDVQVSVDPPVSSVLTDALGYYEIENVEPGQYTVNAVKANYTSFSVDISAQAGTVTKADLLLTKSTGAVTGKVLRASDGSPVSGAYIKTNPGSGTVLTDASGVYSFENIAPGTITITADKQGFTTASVSVQIKSSITIQADILLDSN